MNKKFADTNDPNRRQTHPAMNMFIDSLMGAVLIVETNKPATAEQHITPQSTRHEVFEM